jgi:hypothetical protein
MTAMYSTLTKQAEDISTNGVPFNPKGISDKSIETLSCRMARDTSRIGIEDASEIIKYSLHYLDEHHGLIIKKDGIFSFRREAFELVETLSVAGTTAHRYARAIKLLLSGRELKSGFRQVLTQTNNTTHLFYPQTAKSADAHAVWRHSIYEQKWLMSLLLKNNTEYNGYYCESRNISQIAYTAITQEISINDAISKIRDSRDSIWVNGITLEQENRLARWLFGGDLITADSEFLTEEFRLIKNKESFFNNEMYPAMMRVQNVIAEMLVREWTAYFGRKSPAESFIYHISPYRVGVLLRKDFNIKEVFPNTYQNMRAVPDISYESMIEGGDSY